MKRIFILFLIVVSAVIASVARAEQTTVVLTAGNWQDVFNKIEAGYIKAFGGALTTASTTSRPSVFHPYTSDSFINILFVPGKVTITNVTDGSSTVTLSQPITLSRGIYLTMGYKDTAGYYYIYVYTISGYVASTKFQYSTSNCISMRFNGTAYYTEYARINVNSAVDTLTKVLYDWQGGT
jgi:hypothetical protein